MKSKTGKKKDLQKPVNREAEEQPLKAPDSDEITASATNDSTDADDKDDDLPEEHIKGLDEALKGADRGEPVTLKEFKKMAKKWGSK